MKRPRSSESVIPINIFKILLYSGALFAILGVSLAQDDQCNVKDVEKHDCGWFGITPEQCRNRLVYGRYCCFDSTPRGAAPQCYHANDSVYNVPLALRRECGWEGMEKWECERRQCTFSHSLDPNEENNVICYYPRFSHCFIPESVDSERIPCEPNYNPTTKFNDKKHDKARIECEANGCCYDPSKGEPKCYKPDPKRTEEGVRKWLVGDSWWSYIPVINTFLASIPPVTRLRIMLIALPMTAVLAIALCCLYYSASQNTALVRAKEV